MNFKSIVAALSLILAPAFMPTEALAVTVLNGSFEDPGGPFSNPCGGPGCSYSVGAIPDWVNAGTTGQFQPGGTGNGYFNFLPDGPTIAYSNGGPISQLVGTAAVGTTYKLLVDVGNRKDGPYSTSALVDLQIGGIDHLAVGTYPIPGDWTTYSLVYTATASDDGKPVSVILDAPSAQGNWDNVRLLSAVPEASTWAMMLLGFASVGFMAYRRKSTSGSFRLA